MNNNNNGVCCVCKLDPDKKGSKFSSYICCACESKIINENCAGCGNKLEENSEIVKTNHRNWHKKCYITFHDNIQETIASTTSTNTSKHVSVQITDSRSKSSDNSTFYFYPASKERTDSNYGPQLKQTLPADFRPEEIQADEISLYPERQLSEDDDNLVTNSNSNFPASNNNIMSKHDDVKAPWALFFSTTCNDLVVRFKVMGLVQNDLIRGSDIIEFLISSGQCYNKRQAYKIGNRLVSMEFLTSQSDSNKKVFESDDIYQINENPTVIGNEKTQNGEIISGPIHMEGWLIKQGHIVKSWKKRWFVLDNEVLRYYKKEDDIKCLGELKMSQYSVGPAEMEGEGAFLFKVYQPGHTLYLQASNLDEYNTWIQYLIRAKTPNM